jgi:peptide/nickel transport system ATP-binding protein
MNKQALLSVKNLSISFKREKEFVPVVHHLSYELCENEILGIVGESGSGKSVSSLAIMGLLPKGISQISEGSIALEGNDLTSISAKD